MGSLTKRQKQIIIGCLLGDGAMRCKDNALLEINHGISQRDYVDWKFQELKNIVRTPPKKRFGNKGRVAYRFTTKSLPELTHYHERFYTGRKKKIPRNLEISRLGLAVWFMDDGCKSHKAVYFNTHKFDLKSQQRLMDKLKVQHGIKTTLNRDKTYWRIRVAVRSVGRLKKLIASLVLPKLQYKLPS